MDKIGFEYMVNEGKIPFEIFLNYTDEKEKSSVVLGNILSNAFSRDEMTILDIGSGNGEYLRLALNNVSVLNGMQFTLLEPSVGLFKHLKTFISDFPVCSKIKIINTFFEDFSEDNHFDIILASHLPFKKDKLLIFYNRVLKMLNKGGELVVVLRCKDDVHYFRTKFKTELMHKKYVSLTIDDAIKIFNKIAKSIPIKISKFYSESALSFPIKDNAKDAISIIEFFLNKKWEEISIDMHERILGYINYKNCKFKQIDGFLVVKKL